MCLSSSFSLIYNCRDQIIGVTDIQDYEINYNTLPSSLEPNNLQGWFFHPYDECTAQCEMIDKATNSSVSWLGASAAGSMGIPVISQ